MSFTKYKRLDFNESRPKGSSCEIDFGSYYENEFSNESDDIKKKYFSYNSAENQKNYKSFFTYGSSSHSSFKISESIKKTNVLMWCVGNVITFVLYLVVLATFPLSMWYTLKKVKDYQRLVIYRLGIRLSVRSNGRYIVLPVIDNWTMVDMRTKAFNVPPQQVLLSDGAGIEVGADVYYQIADPVLSISACCDTNFSVRLLVQTTMTRHLAKHILVEITNKNKTLIQHLMMDLNQFIDPWGLVISRLDLSEVKILTEPKPGMGGSDMNPLDIFKSIISSFSSHSDESDRLVNLNPGNKDNCLVDISLSKESDILEKDCFSVDLLVNLISHRINANVVKEFGIIYKFIISGVGGGIFIMDLKNGNGSISSDSNTQEVIADVLINISFDDMRKIFNGSLSTFNAYMSGRLEVDGDLPSAMKLQELLNQN